MMTLGINFFCFIYVTIIDRQKKPVAAAEEEAELSEPRRKFSMLKVWMPVLLLLVFLMLLYWMFG
jgi:hypothetical protein